LKNPFKIGDSVICIDKVGKLTFGTVYTIEEIGSFVVRLKEIPMNIYEWDRFVLIRPDEDKIWLNVLMKRIGYE
jgi:hypothetical protein